MRAGLVLGLLPSEMLERATPRDMSILAAFDAVEPIGDRRLDFNVALLRRTVIQTVAKKPPDLEKLLPDWWAKPEGADGG